MPGNRVCRDELIPTDYMAVLLQPCINGGTYGSGGGTVSSSPEHAFGATPWQCGQDWATGWVDAISLALIFAVAMGLTVWLSATQQGRRPKSMVQSWENVAMALFLAPIAIAAAVVILAILLPWAVFIYGVCLPLSRGLATLLSRMEPSHPLRWIAFTIFVIGFHFDLLAS